jgi:translation initiation factor 4A
MYDEVTEFDSMDFPTALLRGVYSFGFDTPSKVQRQAIVPIKNGLDTIAQAPSGTGKTGAFVIGALARIHGSLVDSETPPAVRCVILSPTRELAIQTCDVAKALSRFIQSPHSQEVVGQFVGGESIRENLSRARSSPAIAVGTPGRVIDLITRGALVVSNVDLLILDECDELLSRGFEDQIKETLRFLQKDCQTVFVSATMSDEVRGLMAKIIREPCVKIFVERSKVSLEGISQFYVSIEEQHKLETLRDLYANCSVAQSVIFASSKRKVDWLEEQLTLSGHAVSAIHSDMDRERRQDLIRQFKAGTTRVLVASDIIGRGIDAQHVSCVINYDLPHDKAQYIHRVGRCGRYGRKGIAINFVTPSDVGTFREIESHYSITIPELPADFRKYMDDC